MNKKIKERLSSKTYWLGLLVIVLTFTQDNFGLIQQYLGDNANAANYAVGVLILVLRELTKEPLSGKIKDKNDL
jgi:uncharacterized membrane protein